jgi:hypothetical protein
MRCLVRLFIEGQLPTRTKFGVRMQKLARIKVADKFTFPLEVDTAKFMGAEDASSAEPDLYDLMAILIHKGGSATHGHYGTLLSFPISPCTWSPSRILKVEHHRAFFASRQWQRIVTSCADVTALTDAIAVTVTFP